MAASNNHKISTYSLLLEEEKDPRVQEEIEKRKRVGLYQIKCQLGVGNFSKVKLAVHMLTKEMVAMKVIDKGQMDTHSRTVLSQEITCMERLIHTNIIRLFEVIETFSHLHLIMEYAPEGDMEQRLKREGHFNEDKGRVIYRQIVSGVDYMHSKGVIHRDIKAENIFFLRGLHIKIGDFGFSTTTSIDNLHTHCGSPPYAAPELHREECYNGKTVDTWALGVLLYYMMTGNLPFNGNDTASIKDKVLNGQLPPCSNISLHCTHLIQCILQPYPNDRLTPRKILTSDWLSKVGGVTEEEEEGCVSSDNSCESLDIDILTDMTQYYGIPSTVATSDIIGNTPRNDIAGTYRILHNRKVSTLQQHPLEHDRNIRERRREKSKICIIL